jgi:myo-inositol-1-phosphate synthase
MHMEDEKTTQESPAVGEFSDELRRLGKQMGEAVKAAWESETSRNAQAQLRDGLAAMTRQLEEAARKVQASEETHRLRQQAERVVESARASDVAEEMRQGLLTGLRDLNAALEKAVDRLRDDKPAEK